MRRRAPRLLRATTRPKATCASAAHTSGKGKNKLVNQCLIEDASQALTFLRGLPGQAPTP